MSRYRNRYKARRRRARDSRNNPSVTVWKGLEYHHATTPKCNEPKTDKGWVDYLTGMLEPMELELD